MKYRRDVRFGEPIPDGVIEDMSKKKYALKSYANMKWCVAMFRAWKFNRNSLYPGSITLDLDDVSTFTNENFVYGLSRFIVETRKKDGSEFPPKTLKQIILLIQMYLKSLGFIYEFLEDVSFAGLTNCLDNKMKLNASKGLGRKVRKAEPLEAYHIDALWKGGYLGDDQPQKLLDTMLVLVGINFGLRAGKEHRILRRPGFDSQLSIIEVEGVQCLEYTEDLSTKTNQGGLKHEQLCAKSAVAYPCQIPSRCIVELFKKYTAMLPEGGKCSAFYLKVNSKKNVKKGGSQFKDFPVGEHTLSNVVKKVTGKGNFSGFFTNHSLRSSCATVLYNDPCNLPEQVIAERTGHRSLAIRSYKRTRKNLKRKVSDILTDYSAGIDNEENVKVDDKVQLTPMKHEVLKAARQEIEAKVHNVKVDICLSLKE